MPSPSNAANLVFFGGSTRLPDRRVDFFAGLGLAAAFFRTGLVRDAGERVAFLPAALGRVALVVFRVRIFFFLGMSMRVLVTEKSLAAVGLILIGHGVGR